MRFRRGSNGWYEASVARWIVDEAKRERLALNESRGTTGNTTLFSSKAWAGIVAEPRVKVWLGEMGVKHRLNGGHDSLPDLVIGGVSVAIKSPVARWLTPEFKGARVAAQFRTRMTEDEILWAGIEDSGEGPVTLMILGGMPSREFFERATLIRKGEQYDPKKTPRAVNDLYQLPISEVQSPDDWLERVAGLVPNMPPVQAKSSFAATPPAICQKCGFRKAMWEAEHEEIVYVPTAPDEPVTTETTYSIVKVCAGCAHNYERKRQMRKQAA